jgi:hypothetical protein
MTDAPLYFVVAFSRSEALELRAEVAIKVPSRQQAASLASRLADGARGAIALSRSAWPQGPGNASLEILARFGDVPDDRALRRQFGDDRNWGGIAIAPAAPFPRSMPSKPRPPDARMRAPSLPAQPKPASAKPVPAKPALRKPPRYARVSACLAAAGVVIWGSTVLVIAAHGAQREARLLELARPACEHAGTSNDDMHRLVKFGYKGGVSKKAALEKVIALCQARRTSPLL